MPALPDPGSPRGGHARGPSGCPLTAQRAAARCSPWLTCQAEPSGWRLGLVLWNTVQELKEVHLAFADTGMTRLVPDTGTNSAHLTDCAQKDYQ